MRSTGRFPVGPVSWLAVLAVALYLPHIEAASYYLSTAIMALTYVALALAFDLVVGGVGALSLAQPVFFGFGAYTAALLSHRYHLGGLWTELPVALGGAALLSLAIGIPSFRLSLHSFAIGTLGFALIAQLIVSNWISFTGGPLCITPVPPLTIGLPGGSRTLVSLDQQYYAFVGVAIGTIGAVALISRSRLGLAYSAVRDDPLLASSRGLWPTQLRLSAFAISAAMSALVGVFFAHYQTVVCPSQMDIYIMELLLIMVFVGGRGSRRGVVVAAIVFTVVPEYLRVAAAWRLAVFGGLLLLSVIFVPGGFEQLFRATEQMVGRLLDRAPPVTAPATTEPPRIIG